MPLLRTPRCVRSTWTRSLAESFPYAFARARNHHGLRFSIRSHISLRHPQSHASNGTQEERSKRREAISAGLLAPSVDLRPPPGDRGVLTPHPAQVRCVRCLHVVIFVSLLLDSWLPVSIVCFCDAAGDWEAPLDLSSPRSKAVTRGRASPPDIAGRRIPCRLLCLTSPRKILRFLDLHGLFLYWSYLLF
jgi:hypothetical protein